MKLGVEEDVWESWESRLMMMMMIIAWWVKETEMVRRMGEGEFLVEQIGGCGSLRSGLRIGY